MRPQTPRRHPVHRAVNRPLLVCGVERRLFFFGLMLGAAVFNLFYSILAGLLTTTVLYAFGLWATRRDPQMLRILLSSARRHSRYDPGKHSPFSMEVQR